MMTISTRNQARWAIAGLLGAAPFAAGAAYQAIQTHRDNKRLPGTGERIDVDGRLVHVRRSGMDQPGPTVVFESGLALPLEAWGWVQPAVADVAPAVSYDRAGIGRSQPATGPRTAEQATAGLVRLLEVLGVTGPLVLVGHSYGGLLLRDFVQRHPERVAGIVLLDPTHPQQFERSVRQRRGIPHMKAHITNAALASRFGWRRLLKLSGDSSFLKLGETERETLMARTNSTRHWYATLAEFDAWMNDVIDATRHATVPPGVPVCVLTSGAINEADPAQTKLHRELAALSCAGIHHVLTGASHLDMVCSRAYARGATEAVLDVVDAARTGRTPKQMEINALAGGNDA